ncbi:MAG TPA: acyl-CoA dehydrogenase family protein, partial [Haliangium sp.]|nr:acyl-CoA dehydrogenase family protein [Haliangium sp.]
MERTLFDSEHEMFRQSFRQFLAREAVPHQERWRAEGMVDRAAWRKAGEQGFLCPWLSEEDGGPGGDFLHSVIVIEELARVYESGFAMSLHSDIVVPYIETFGTREQKQRWLPGCASGELVTAIAMTEPNTGSDLAAIRTTAVRDGDFYVLDGAKTFISNGILCDLCVVAAKTDPNPENAHRGISLFVVEASTPGF